MKHTDCQYKTRWNRDQFLGWLVLFSLLSGCQSAPKTAGYNPTEKPPEKLVGAIQLQEQGRWSESETELRAFVLEKPTTRWQRAAEFHQGLALEEQERFQEALELYRGVSRDSERIPDLQAESLFRSSFCFEELGDENGVIASLNDAWLRKEFLPLETREAELPARLASAYARAGNLQEADKFFKLAEEGLIKLRSQSVEETPQWLGRTMYVMGKFSASGVDWTTFRDSIRPLPRAQAYLVRAAALGHKPSAEKAESDLVGIYTHLLRVVEGGDPLWNQQSLVERRDSQRKQWEYASEVFELVRQLRNHLTIQSRRVASVYKLADDSELRVQRVLAGRPIGEGLTPEAMSRLPFLQNAREKQNEQDNQ